jgi:small subunit ribosomal protein S6
MSGLYDLMLMLDPNAPEERQSQIVGQVRSMIESSGTLVGAHDWGTRRMAYEIDHRPDAAYHLFQFEGENPLLEQLDHTLKITDGVLRFRVIKLKPGTPPPPTPRPEAPRPRPDEVEDRTVAPRSAADQPAAQE